MKTLKSVSGIHGASPFGQNNKVKNSETQTDYLFWLRNSIGFIWLY